MTFIRLLGNFFRYACPALAMAACFCLLYWFHFRGLISHDEGWFLYAGERLLQGENIYKDFQFVYTPGLVYLTSLSYLVFGISVWSTRLLALINSMVALGLLGLIAKKIQLPFLSSTFLLLTFLFWGPAHINFVWPVMFCLTTSLATSTALLYAETEKNPATKVLLFFLSGITTALTGLLKQNFGVALILANLIFFILRKSHIERRQLIAHFGGMVAVGLLQLIYLLTTDSVTWFFSEMWFITYEKIIRDGILNSSLPWNYPARWYARIFKVCLYLLPLFLSLIALIKFHSHRYSFLIHLPLVSTFFFLLSFRPTTDYIHLTPLLALSSICLVVVTSEFKNYFVQLSLSFFLSLFLFAAAYSALFRNYYGWDTPLIAHNYQVDHPRIGITVDHKTTVTVLPLAVYLKKTVPAEEKIFVYSFTPLMYFLTDKDNPTRYDYVHRGMLTPELENNVSQALLSDQLQTVVTDHSLKHDPSLIAKTIEANFTPTHTFGDYIVWRK
ncbi:MAG TPA: hypothetical protein VF209_00090 [Patescibacteria group bacterium]